MAVQIPEILQNMKLYENGTEFIGLVDIGLPQLKRKTETKQYAGMGAPAKFPTGSLDAPLDITISAAELRTSVLVGFTKQCDGLRTLNLRQIYKNMANCASGKHNIVAVGFFEQVDLGSVKMGEDTQRKYTFTCHKFRYEINGVVVFEHNVMDVQDDSDRQFLG